MPLAIRTNAGEECLDVLLRNEIPEDANIPFSKVGLHIHFVQFDVQASDGLDAGYNYEQTVRPYALEGSPVTAPTPIGAVTVPMRDTNRFTVGSLVGVGADQDNSFEVRRIASIGPGELTFDRALVHSHGTGEIVSTEFVRYRWYPDAQFGTSYFHDHVDAIHGWRHGLFGALIAEPPGSTYTDPHTGQPMASGPIADIHTKARVSADITGSFRELALFIQDDNSLNSVGRSSGSAYNLRAEPLTARPGDPALLFSSVAHGDPATPILEANLGDPLVIRSLVGATNDVHTLHVDGHWFRTEPWTKQSAATSTIHIGISERYDLAIPAAGGPQRRSGDYLYYSGHTFKLQEGSWGLVRVNKAGAGGLQALPGRQSAPPEATTTCPRSAPVKQFAVSAIRAKLPMLQGDNGLVYVLDSDRAAVASGQRKAEPLVLHINVGDCVNVRLHNATASADPPGSPEAAAADATSPEAPGSVTFHCDILAADPATSGGVAAGNEPNHAVAPGATGNYTFYAAPEVGETVALIRDWGNVVRNPGLGLYGAIVVGPRGATYKGSGPQVDVLPRSGAPYRDVTLFWQDHDEGIGTHRMPYSSKVSGPAAINYESAPAAPSAGLGVPASRRSRIGDIVAAGDPPTPVVRAFAGDPVRFHVVAPWSAQNQVFAIEDHWWPVEPGIRGSTRVSAQQIGGLEAVTLRLEWGAGGVNHRPGDYIYGAARGAYSDAGMWGVFRVLAAGDQRAGTGVKPLIALPVWRPRTARSDRTASFLVVLGIALSLGTLMAVNRPRHGPTRRLRHEGRGSRGPHGAQPTDPLGRGRVG